MPDHDDIVGRIHAWICDRSDSTIGDRNEIYRELDDYIALDSEEAAEELRHSSSVESIKVIGLFAFGSV